MSLSGLVLLTLATTLLILALSTGVRGTGGLIDVALMLSAALLASGAFTWGRRRGKQRGIRLP
jgi:hypothetical protein